MCIFRNDVRINIKSIERTGFANFSINKFLFFEFFRKLLSLRLLRFFLLFLSRLQFSYHRWKQVILQIISEICLVSFFVYVLWTLTNKVIYRSFWWTKFGISQEKNCWPLHQYIQQNLVFIKNESLLSHFYFKIQL